MARASYLESARAMALGTLTLADFCAAMWPALSPPLTFICLPFLYVAFNTTTLAHRDAVWIGRQPHHSMGPTSWQKLCMPMKNLFYPARKLGIIYTWQHD
jgi:hypothetical protein